MEILNFIEVIDLTRKKMTNKYNNTLLETKGVAT